MARAVPRARCAGPLGAAAPAITRSRIATASGMIPLLIWFTAMLTAADGSVSAATCASAPGAASGARAGAGAGFRAADLGRGLTAVPLAEGAPGVCAQQVAPPLDERQQRRLACRCGEQGQETHWQLLLQHEEGEEKVGGGLQGQWHAHLGQSRSRGGQGRCRRRLGGRRWDRRPRKQRLRLERNRQVIVEGAASHCAAPELHSLLQRAAWQG